MNVNKILNNFVEKYRAGVKKAGALDPSQVHVTDTIDKKLATITYLPGPSPHIIFNWPLKIGENKEISGYPIWHLCPAQVYLFKNAFTGYPKIIIQYEGCIKCETCWHSMDIKDSDGNSHSMVLNWSRFGPHRLIYEVYSSSVNEFEKYKTDDKNNFIKIKDKIAVNEIVPHNPALNETIRNFRLACIHFSHVFNNKGSSLLLDNASCDWMRKLFKWASLF
ncbi:hypothetical protein HY745_02375 [Candidatus Desantisbacteria bacterium]|nr:hypothetical protein [Candidatus Desantisbacteria bacterium]